MRLPLSILLVVASTSLAADGNRFAYLDDLEPYYPHRNFPKLITPQWIGEPGVDAVVILAIDDMRGHEKWEAYLRPIIDRLKQHYGTAPVSIMTCRIEPDEPHLQKWLKEGLGLEVHTYDHPCPILGKGDFAAAKATYDRCVDLMASIPNNKPVAFRTPCCDSLNTVSPRLFAEIINKTTAKGNFLQLDSSVFNVFTPDDPDLQREWVTEGDGRARFLKYLPADRDFVNVIHDYPYPYVIGGCWEFPCATPSDWQAQHLHKPNNELTVRDWYACLDCTVKKQGVMNLVFHPHGWIKSEQINQLIDYAHEKYGKRVKFLTFREALERINKHVLNGHPVRDPKTGVDNGVRLLDVDGDAYHDVVIGNTATKVYRTWDAQKQTWTETPFPFEARTCRFGVLGGVAVAMTDTKDGKRVWVSRDGKLNKALTAGLPEKLGDFRLLDIDGAGWCELISDGRVYWWRPETTPPGWEVDGRLPGANLDDGSGWDSGFRFVDLDGDGRLDVLLSHDVLYAAYLYGGIDRPWGKKVVSGPRSDANALPPIAVKGTNNGAFIRNRHIYWQNEHTDKFRDLIDKRSFNDLLASIEPGPKTPEQSLKLMTVRPGYRVVLAASEPQVQDPIAIAWGPDGKVWVVEMGDYPNGIDGKGKPGGRVKFLESTNSDWKYDKSTIFLDNIGFPTGVLPWRKGVLVTAAPDILYAEDTDGDGKADVRKVLFTGFAPGNQQHRVNGLVWGLDNWVYCANGDSGGEVTSTATGKKLNIRGRDFRIKPDTGEIELTSGQSQYSKTRDDWGNWFGGNNSIPATHVVLEDRLLARNPHQAGAEAVRVVSSGAVPVYPTSRTVPRFNDPHTANRFTSACGIGFYRDDLFEPALRRALFICEPVHNLVHRLDLVPDGASFTGRRAADEPRSEFLASADNWFRPVMARTGPDGALWVVDMYRHVIEHPEWIPKETEKKLDLRAGHDLGRIYRVTRVGAEHPLVPRLVRRSTLGLVQELESTNGPVRDLAQMMLIWKADKEAVPLLENMVRTSKSPRARLHALSTLDGMGACRTETLRVAVEDEHAGVARHALQLCEGRISTDPNLQLSVDKVQEKADTRLALACMLGSWDDPAAARILGALLRRHGHDKVLATAGLSSLTAKNFPAVAQWAMNNEGTDRPPSAQVMEGLIAFAVAQSDNSTLAKLLSSMVSPKNGTSGAIQLETLASLLDALGRRKSSLAALAKDGGPELKAAIAKLDPAFEQARKTAADSKAPLAERLTAIRLVGRGPADSPAGRALLAELLGPQSASDVQAAAVAALARSDAADTPAVLLKSWKGYSPALRAAVLSALLGREAWVTTVLDALERKEILPPDVDAAARQRLLAHATPAIRERAGKLLVGGIDADRQKVIDAYRPALTRTGDRDRGKQVFVKNCAACHKVADVGKGLGPDLSALSDKSADYLLVNLLDPNRAVEARYVAYTARTTDERTRVGFLSAETATSITLVATDGQEHTILRSDLESLTSSGKSVMPEGLEKDVTVEQMADLLAFLRSALPPAKPKSFAGNKPELIRPTADGSLALLATAAEIYGRTLTFEERYKNLGYWGSADDRAVWTVALPAAGKYEVWLDWACPRSESGKALVIEAGSQSLTTRIETTANWEDYRQAKIGELNLDAGEVRLTARPLPPLKGYLMDLRAVRLVPVKGK